jgi:putative endonuclease
MEHRSGEIDGFTRKYKIRNLVYFEETNDIVSALEREKELKAWRRSKKTDLVKTLNPEWRDLSENFLDPER